MELNRRDVLIAGVLLEGVLVLIFALWAFFTGFRDKLFPSMEHLIWGFALALPLLLVNFLFFEVISRKFTRFQFCVSFVDEVVKPLADTLGWGSGLLIALCAGFGEELFFRGVIQTEFGLIIASLLFSVLHFGTAIREYLFIACLYAVIGLYLGLVFNIFGTLWVPIILHSSYDFLALLYLRYVYKVRLKNQVFQPDRRA